MTGQYHETDRWTTQDGEIYPSDKPYAIDQEHAKRMAQEQIEGAGCATCFFVKLEGGPDKEVHYFTTAGLTIDKPVDSKGWAHNEMYGPDSSYNPKNNVGPWSAIAKEGTSDIIDGVGLPLNNHMATFAVLTWQENGESGGDSGPTEPPPPSDSTLPATITSVVRVGDAVYSGTLTKQGAVG